jgi:hypothetical protein
MKLLHVENHPELRKDPDSGVVFFFDEVADREYQTMKMKAQKEKVMQKEIEELKKDMGDIKSMLTTLINK